MKLVRLSFTILAVLLISAGTSNAFHSGGVAECVGCHSMHHAASGSLLTMDDVSSTCLDCHEATSGSSYHISTAESAMGVGLPPLNRTPGGDFAWLKKDYTWNPGWAPQNEDGDRHGHNIVAQNFGYAADVTNTTTPGGGSMDPADLSCTSCHDQHGTLRRLNSGLIAVTGAPIIGSGSYGAMPGVGEAVGVYRLLRGDGGPDGSGGVAFTSPVPAAVVPSSYNRSEAVTDTRVAYGAGMGDFCATCHPTMHQDASGLLNHPMDQAMSAAIRTNYGDYVGSGDLTGALGTSYDSLIPFQRDNSTDYVELLGLSDNTGTVTSGPAGGDRVNCLSCHRAHASGWEYATRWDNEIELIIVDGEWPGTDAVSAVAAEPKWAKGRSVAERSKAYNDTDATDYATYQRVLCNKCHAKD